jgi:hypothetical protein
MTIFMARALALSFWLTVSTLGYASKYRWHLKHNKMADNKSVPDWHLEHFTYNSSMKLAKISSIQDSFINILRTP